jgi:hypothetical protein
MHKEIFFAMSHEGYFLSRTQKESILGIFKNTLNANLLDVLFFIDNWLNQFSFNYEFLKSRSWSLERPLMSKTQMITIFTFVVLMTSLDHSLVHALNKQKYISNV